MGKEEKNSRRIKKKIKHLRNCKELEYEQRERREILEDNGKGIGWMRKGLRRQKVGYFLFINVHIMFIFILREGRIVLDSGLFGQARFRCRTGVEAPFGPVLCFDQIFVH